MDRAWRLDIFVDGPSNGGRKYIWLVKDIPVRVSIENSEESGEIIRRLVDVEDRNCAVRTYALPEAPNGDPHGAHGVFPLRGSVVGDDDGLFSRPDLDGLNGLLEERHSQCSSASRERGMLVVGAFAFHDAVRLCACVRHRSSLGQ